MLVLVFTATDESPAVSGESQEITGSQEEEQGQSYPENHEQKKSGA